MRHPTKEEIEGLIPLMDAIDDATTEYQRALSALRKKCGMFPGISLDIYTAKWQRPNEQGQPVPIKIDGT